MISIGIYFFFFLLPDVLCKLFDIFWFWFDSKCPLSWVGIFANYLTGCSDTETIMWTSDQCNRRGLFDVWLLLGSNPWWTGGNRTLLPQIRSEIKYFYWFVITIPIQSVGQGNVFTDVCLSTEGSAFWGGSAFWREWSAFWWGFYPLKGVCLLKEVVCLLRGSAFWDWYAFAEGSAFWVEGFCLLWGWSTFWGVCLNTRGGLPKYILR